MPDSLYDRLKKMTTTAGQKELFEKALESGRKRDYRRAAELLENLMSETDDFPIALLYLGRSYHALGDYDNAILHLKLFVQRVPGESAGYFFLGRTYLSLGFSRRSIVYFKKALELRPHEPSVLGLLGIAYLKTKRPELASKVLGEALELEEENRKLQVAYLNALSVHAVKEFYSGDLDLARQMFEFLLDQGNDPLFARVYLSMIAKELEDYDTALYQCEQALKLSPKDPLLRFRRAAMLYFTGDKDRAFEELHKLRAVFPDLQTSVFEGDGINKHLALQHFQQGDYRQTVHYGFQVLKSGRADPVMHMLVGESYRNLGEIEKAKNHFTRAIEKDRRALEPRFGLSMILWEQEKYEEMLKELDRIRAIDPDNPTSRYYAVLCICKLGYAPEQTIPLVQEEIRNSGPDPYLFTELGIQYVRGGLAELADKWFKKALLLKPEHREAYTCLLELYTETGNEKEALGVYRDYLQIYPDDTQVRKSFITLLVKREEFTQVIDQIMKFMPYSKGDEQIKRLLALSLRRTRQYTQAAVLYKDLLIQDAENVEFIKSLTYCYLKSGRQDYARQFVQKAAEHIKNCATLFLISGVLLYKNDEFEDALSAFRRAADIAPDDWRAYQNIGHIYKKQGMNSMAQKFISRAEKYRKKTT
jgi:tetratricopeptide (TPR) repeat protein